MAPVEKLSLQPGHIFFSRVPVDALPPHLRLLAEVLWEKCKNILTYKGLRFLYYDNDMKGFYETCFVGSVLHARRRVHAPTASQQLKDVKKTNALQLADLYWLPVKHFMKSLGKHVRLRNHIDLHPTLSTDFRPRTSKKLLVSWNSVQDAKPKLVCYFTSYLERKLSTWMSCLQH